MNRDQWYFAYGSNLFIDQKEQRTGTIRQAVRCRLPGFRLAFNKRGDNGQVYANIVADDAADVWGVCYLCNPTAIAEMDRFEGVASGHYEQITTQVDGLLETQRQLRQETGNLVKALRSPVVRGRWGEIQLRKVVELAGMVNHCDFFEQQSVDGENGKLRPDLIVKLPAQKQVVVDSKCPLSAYLEALDCTGDEARKAKLQAHAMAVRTHITALSRKSYFEQFDQTPEFVVLFMPGEVFFGAALEHDPELIEAGVEQNVIIATPTTLIALLRAVAYGWRQERLAENAKAISDLGAELYKRLVTVGDYLSALGKKLRGAVEAYNDTVASLETRVLTTARKFDELHVSMPGTSEIGELLRIDTTPRPLNAPEFVGRVGETEEVGRTTESCS